MLMSHGINLFPMLATALSSDAIKFKHSPLPAVMNETHRQVCLKLRWYNYDPIAALKHTAIG